MTTHSPTPSPDPNTTTRSRLGFRIRVVVFVIVVLACGWYSRFFQSIWTTFSPLTCAGGNTALFAVDFDAIPARISDQANSCTGMKDGECQRNDHEEILHGECRNGQMHGAWSLQNTKTGTASWSGTYCNGLPCGEFHQRIDAQHENVFRIDNLHLHGPTTIWTRQGERFLETSGHFERSKRKGRWVYYIEPAHTLLAASVYDENGFVTTTSLYCTNGNRQEVRGKEIFLLDGPGNVIAKRAVDERDLTPALRTIDPSLCPVP